MSSSSCLTDQGADRFDYGGCCAPQLALELSKAAEHGQHQASMMTWAGLVLATATIGFVGGYIL
jgi:hypothetical protein